MAWTQPPNTACIGQTITADMWNTYLRDNTAYLKARADIADYRQVLDNITSAVPLTGNTNENILYGFAIPANTLGTTGMLRLKIHGTLSSPTGGQTETFRFKLGCTLAGIGVGGTTMVTDARSFTSATKPFIIEAVLIAEGATNSQRMLASSTMAVNWGDTGVAYEDMTAAKNLVVTYQSTNSSATCVLYAATLELLPAL